MIVGIVALVGGSDGTLKLDAFAEPTSAIIIKMLVTREGWQLSSSV
jgi:hypothetical protein